MIDPEAIRSIIGTYEKHGWKLRRVLLSAELEATLRGNDLFDHAKVRSAEVDGIWFSRRSRRGVEAWELRAISLSPFALLENIPDDLSQEEVEDILQRTEERLAETVIRPTVDR